MEKLISIYYLVCKQRHLQCLQKPLSLQNKKDFLRASVVSEHQKPYRSIYNDAYNQAVEILWKDNITKKKFIDFEDLYDHIRALLLPIIGIGNLTIYDTALRIGYKMKIFPQQYVYLAAGALEGAKKLFPNRKFKFREPIQMFHPLFGNMNSLDIEDFLCVMKKYLAAGGANHSEVTNLMNSIFPANGLEQMYYNCCCYLYEDESMTTFKADSCENDN